MTPLENSAQSACAGASLVPEDALALARLAVRTERHGEAEASLRALLESGAAPHLAAPAARLLAESRYLAGRHDACLSALDEAADRGWLPAGDAEADLLRGWIALRRGQARPAREQAARHLAAAPPDPGTRARLLHLRGMCEHRLGRPRAARRDLRDAAALFRLAADQAGEAEALNALGIVEKSAGDLRRAAARFAEALELNRALGLAGRRAQNLLNLAVVQLKSGRTGAALPPLREARAVQEQRGARQSLLRIRIAMARALLQAGDPAAARAELAPCFPEASALQAAREEGLALETLGDISLACGHHAPALRAYERALAIAQDTAPAGDLAAELLRRLGQLHLARGDVDGAAALLRRAARLSAGCGERFEEGVALRLLARAHAAQGRWARAYRTCRAALVTLRDHGAALEAALCSLTAAEIRFAWWQAERRAGGDTGDAAGRGHREAAWSYLLEAFHGFDDLARPQERAACEAVMGRMRLTAGLCPAPAPSVPGAAACSAGAADVFIARAPAMQRVLRLTRIAAGTDEPVLITGETGTGKEVLARLLHAGGPRAAGPFVPVNCAAIPETLFEREFFGASRGAYTGADRDRPGLCETAAAGVLFLDEIGDMPLPVQAKLLRLLQEGTFRRLGDPGERRADLRVVAATNADLPLLIAARRFRQDLYYRLQTLELQLPPLRDRGEDLDALIELFVARAVGPAARAAELFDPEVRDALRRHVWPGNVRELEATTRRLALLAVHAGRATPEMLPPALTRRPPRGVGVAGDLNLARRLAQAEREHLAGVLALFGGNRAEAARQLGISRNALYKKMQRLEVNAAS